MTYSAACDGCHLSFLCKRDPGSPPSSNYPLNWEFEILPVILGKMYPMGPGVLGSRTTGSKTAVASACILYTDTHRTDSLMSGCISCGEPHSIPRWCHSLSSALSLWVADLNEVLSPPVCVCVCLYVWSLLYLALVLHSALLLSAPVSSMTTRLLMDGRCAVTSSWHPVSPLQSGSLSSEREQQTPKAPSRGLASRQAAVASLPVPSLPTHPPHQHHNLTMGLWAATLLLGLEWSL